ncbi:hypothetical protein [Streptomyces sennicomposti]
MRTPSAPAAAAFLRRRLLRLSVQLWWDPYWQTVPSVPAARAELCRSVRACDTAFKAVDRRDAGQ